MASVGISVNAHLKAAAIDIISEHFLWNTAGSEATASYTILLLQAYWREADSTDIIQDVKELFPEECFLLFAAFCVHNYPELTSLLV